MSSTDDIVNLELVLIRLGSADTDEQLQTIVFKYLPLLLSKISSTESNVRSRVMEVLTHINKRIKSRPLVQVPIEPLLDLYKDPQANSFLINFAIIYIKIGYPRLPLNKQVELSPLLLRCLVGKPEMHYDKIIPLVLPILSDIGKNKGTFNQENALGLDEYPQLKSAFLNYVCDILLLPYGYNQDATTAGFTPPPAMSMYSFKRVTLEPVKPEDLQRLKECITSFLSSGIISPEDALLPLVIASSDTRFSVVNPAISELAKITSSLDWTNSTMVKPLYVLFSGSIHKLAERKTSPADPRVKMKVLQYLHKVRGGAMNATLALKVIFEGLFGNTNDKCRKMTLSFAKLMINECSKEELQPVINILFNGLLKITSEEYPEDVRNAAYMTLAIIPAKCPEVFLQRRDLVVVLFDKITQESETLQSSIRDLLIAITSLFRYDSSSTSNSESAAETNLVIALLAKHIEGSSFNASFVATVYLMTCFPPENVAARYLLLMGLHNDLLKEKIYTDIYGTYKLNNIKYSQLQSIDTLNNQMEVDDSKESSDSESEKMIILPSFKALVDYVYEQASKRRENRKVAISYKNILLPYNTKVFSEIIRYLHLCLFMSAGLNGPSPLENVKLLSTYIQQDPTFASVKKYINLLKELLLVSKGETEISCMIDILGCVQSMATEHMDLLPLLQSLLHDTSREKRDLAAKLYGMLCTTMKAFEFEKEIQSMITQSKSANISDENKHGLILAFSNACERRIQISKRDSSKLIESNTYTIAVNALLQHVMSSKPMIIEAACVGISLMSRCSELPMPNGSEIGNFKDTDFKEINDKAILVRKLFILMYDSSLKSTIREKAIFCLGHICTGEKFPWTRNILEGFMGYLKETKDVDMHLSISKSIVCCILGTNSPEAKDVWSSDKLEPSISMDDSSNDNCEYVLEYLLSNVKSVHPNSRQACAIWLLAIVKNCSTHPMVKKQLYAIQSAFIDLLSEENDIVQDSASSGLGLVYLNTDSDQQKQLAITLLEQLSGGSRNVKQVTSDTTVYEEGSLGKSPTGGNLSTYKELCSLASDLNQPDLIYKFMQLANHNANWNSKLGAAFGIQSIAKLAQQEIQVYLPKIISRLYRYKFDPIPKIQNSMSSIWNAIVQDNKSTISQFHNEIIADLLSNITHHQWRVRMSCCLALSDILRSHPLPSNEQVEQMWTNLFRVMDDFHEATRNTAENTTKTLSKICVLACKSDGDSKAGIALASTFLPVLLDKGITHTVKEIRNISLSTISELVQCSGPMLKPHMLRLIPALLQATGELESAYLNQLSTMWGARQEAQEALDCARADAAKGHAATKTMSKCIEFMDLEALQNTTPYVVDLMRNSVVLGTKVACAHYLNIIVSVKRVEVKSFDKSLMDKIFSTLLSGLADRNAAVKRSHAEAIGHMVGVASETSLQKLFDKLWKSYFSNKVNKRAAIARTILSINQSEPDVLRTYSEKVIPLVFFAMHEDKNEENAKTVEMWNNIWNDVTSGDSDVKNHIKPIMNILKVELESQHWSMKAQAANAVSTVAKKVGSSLSEEERIGILDILLSGLSGRTWSGKQHLLAAVVDICKCADKNTSINKSAIFDAIFRECRKKEPIYRKFAIMALGNLLEAFDEEDRFEEFHTAFSDLLKMDVASMEMDSEDITEKAESRKNYLALKEVIWESFGKAWPSNFETQDKYRTQFLDICSDCLKMNTRNIQLQIMIAMNKYTNKLILVENSNMVSQDHVQQVVDKMISIILYALDISFTSIKKEALGIIQTMIMKVKEHNLEGIYKKLAKTVAEDITPKIISDKAPEIQSRIKDIQDNLKDTDK